MEHEHENDKEFPDDNINTAPDFIPELDLHDQELLDAVRQRDQQAVQRLLKEDGNLRGEDGDGETVLHLAVKNDDKSMVQLLLDKGANPEIASRNGNKALYIAAESGYLKLVKLLLQNKANVESHNVVKQRTALYQAVENGHATIAQVLLENEADIDFRIPTGYTPLFCAISHRDLKLVELLLQHGANKDIQLGDGHTLEDAASGDSAIIDFLHSRQSAANFKTDPGFHFQAPTLPVNQIDKLNACQGFEVTIVDFFRDREQILSRRLFPKFSMERGPRPSWLRQKKQI